MRVASISNDGKFLAYYASTLNGDTTKVISITDGKLLAKWDQIIRDFRWGAQAVFVPIVDQEKKFEHIDLTSGESNTITLNLLNYRTIQNEDGRDNKVYLTEKDREHTRIVFNSITLIEDRVFFIAEGSTHFCNAYLFSATRDGSDFQLVTNEVLPETCGALQIVKRDEHSVVLIDNNTPKESPGFYLIDIIDSETNRTRLYQP